MLLPLGEDELDGDLDEELRAMSFLSTAGPHAHSAHSHKLGTPHHDLSLSPSPMSSAMTRMRHASSSSPPVHPAAHDGQCMAQYSCMPVTATNMVCNRNESSAARQIDFVDASPSHDSSTPAAHEHQHRRGAGRMRMRSSAVPAYLGGVSLLAVGDPSDAEDFGFGGLGPDDSAPSLSSEGSAPWSRSIQTARESDVQTSPGTASMELMAACLLYTSPSPRD